MKEITLSDDRILGMGENRSVHAQNIIGSGSVSWLKRLVGGLTENFNAPFQSDWEKKTGLQWKDWGKL